MVGVVRVVGEVEELGMVVVGKDIT